MSCMAVYKLSSTLQPKVPSNLISNNMKSPLLLSLSFFGILSFLFLPSFVHISVISASSFTGRPLCHNNDKIALLQFKQSFTIHKNASRDPSAYPKIESWRLQGEHVDCCSWDGIECDNSTGHVIGLDLSSSYLYGSINSNSSLFQLAYLRGLNLADNNFSHSQIPTGLGHLSQLKYLNLSYSAFSGLVPSDISKLSNLVSLDLSGDESMTSLNLSVTSLPMLKMLDFKSLLQNLTRLEVLHLPYVNIPSTVPSFMGNLSSLESLLLIGCNLHGEFPPAVFQLPNLHYIDISGNGGLGGHLPEFNSSSPLVRLILRGTGFKGELPKSLGNLRSLQYFDTLGSGFFGQIPTSLGNLTQLVNLSLSGNRFEVPNISSLSWIGRLTKLIFLGFNGINFDRKSEIPTYIANLSLLEVLDLENCQITGQIPSWLPKMTQLSSLVLAHTELEGHIPYSISELTELRKLDLSFNKLQGPIPGSIFQLRTLLSLNLVGNNLSGTLELENFLMLQSLTKLFLSGNQLSLDAKLNSTANLPKFGALALGSCNLRHFPHFLRSQDKLELLDLSDNNITGLVPEWIWRISKDMFIVDLSENFLTGFETDTDAIAKLPLSALALDFNMFQGSLPVPPPSIKEYSVGRNNFTGNIPSLFCSLSLLGILDLCHNNLSGILPQCLGDLTASMELFDVRGNNFHGEIPLVLPNDCNLKVLTLGQNQFEGQIPRSLANCARLELLDLGHNQINDIFPAWLAPLQQLKVLILRSNRFHGELGDHQANHDQFSMLQIIDLSHNNFSGQLPAKYLLNWNAMKVADAHHLKYMETKFSILPHGAQSAAERIALLKYSMLVTNKGTELEYSKILKFFVAMDLSDNKFEGEIPESIGNLRELYMLNLSNNILNGSIPSTLVNLTALESLDLSRNNLSGEIPQQLTQLNFLEVFNVSENNLTGPIPRGKQFDTFQNSSYEGNSGLCGDPLSRKCGNSEALPPPATSSSEQNEDMGGFEFQFGWKPIVIGYAGGLLVGLVIGHALFTRRQEWFMKTFRIRLQRRMSISRRP